MNRKSNGQAARGFMKRMMIESRVATFDCSTREIALSFSLSSPSSFLSLFLFSVYPLLPPIISFHFLPADIPRISAPSIIAVFLNETSFPSYFAQANEKINRERVNSSGCICCAQLYDALTRERHRGASRFVHCRELQSIISHFAN